MKNTARMGNIFNRHARPILGVALPVLFAAAMIHMADARAETSAPPASSAVAQPSKQQREEARRLVALGDKHAKGDGVAQDDAEAARLFAKAMELGDLTARLRLGEALINGRGIAADRARGLELIESAAAAGNSAAMVSLSDAVGRGLAGPEARARAIPLLEQAAAAGQAVALVKLGGIYEAGTLARKNSAKAAAYYREAIAAGRADAMVALGRALATKRLRGQGTPEEGIALLRKVQELGNENAVVALSDCYFNGHGVAQNPKQALALLRTAWKAGNTRAGLRLVALYRDGRKPAVSPSPRRAEAYLTEVASKLPEGDVRKERFLLDAKQAVTRVQRDAVVAAFSRFSGADRAALIRRVQAADQNVYVYLVQSELKRLDLMKGRPTGLMSGETIRVIQANCIRYEDPGMCGRGPLTPRVVEVTSSLFLGGD